MDVTFTEHQVTIDVSCHLVWVSNQYKTMHIQTDFFNIKCFINIVLCMFYMFSWKIQSW